MVIATPTPKNDGGSSSGNNTATAESGAENGGQQSSARSRAPGEKEKPTKILAKTAEESIANALRMAKNVMINMGLMGKEGTEHLEAFVTADITRGGSLDTSKVVATVVQNAQKALGDLVTQQGLFAAKNMTNESLCALSPNTSAGKPTQSAAPTLSA
jgi:hypothetical protein